MLILGSAPTNSDLVARKRRLLNTRVTLLCVYLCCCATVFAASANYSWLTSLLQFSFVMDVVKKKLCHFRNISAAPGKSMCHAKKPSFCLWSCFSIFRSDIPSINLEKSRCCRHKISDWFISKGFSCTSLLRFENLVHDLNGKCRRTDPRVHIHTQKGKVGINKKYRDTNTAAVGNGVHTQEEKN